MVDDTLFMEIQMILKIIFEYFKIFQIFWIEYFLIHFNTKYGHEGMWGTRFFSFGDAFFVLRHCKDESVDELFVIC
jgi:hypothetical protein